jgi:transporter family-2 protein
MIGRWSDWLLGFGGGVLLAFMINYNSLLAKYTTPTFASWVAHGLGAVAALVLVAVFRSAAVDRGRRQRPEIKVPLWFYLGGIPGAFTVLLAAITVNSSLTLAGTIAFMLVGQVVFGIVSDYFGLFRTLKRRIVPTDFLVAISVLAGSALIIFGGS